MEQNVKTEQNSTDLNKRIICYYNFEQIGIFTFLNTEQNFLRGETLFTHPMKMKHKPVPDPGPNKKKSENQIWIQFWFCLLLIRFISLKVQIRIHEVRIRINCTQICNSAFVTQWLHDRSDSGFIIAAARGELQCCYTHSDVISICLFPVIRCKILTQWQ